MSQAFQLLLSQRERQRKAAQDLLQQLHAVLDNAEVGIALSRNGRFEIVSRQFCAIFGCEREQAVGQPTRMIYPSDEGLCRALSSRAEPAFLQRPVRWRGRTGALQRRTLLGPHAGAGGGARRPLAGTIWVINDVTRAHRQHEQLSWAASHDKLTGLTNRAAFEVMLEDATAQTTEQPFCALFIDLDRFKRVNDTSSHAAGDAFAARHRGRAHRRAARRRHGGRLGGDEFAVLLPACPAPAAQAIAGCARRVRPTTGWNGRLHAPGRCQHRAGRGEQPARLGEPGATGRRRGLLRRQARRPQPGGAGPA